MKRSHHLATVRVLAGAAVALALGALAGGVSLAADHAPAVRKHHARSTARHHAARAHRVPKPAMRAVLDPRTGRLVPRLPETDAPGSVVPGTAPTAAATGLAPSASTPVVLPVTTLPDGTQLVRLDPSQQEYEVVRVGKDGKLERACVHGDPDKAVFHTREEK